ncbi:MAG: hypothetical protein QM539_10755 [Alphaproteobacteria bacterium]|nr:hypothetical protein [Alphaproteobacteria bacterium]
MKKKIDTLGKILLRHDLQDIELKKLGGGSDKNAYCSSLCGSAGICRKQGSVASYTCCHWSLDTNGQRLDVPYRCCQNGLECDPGTVAGPRTTSGGGHSASYAICAGNCVG